MKLVRFGPRGREKPGIVDDQGRLRDLSKVVPDIAGEALSPKGLAAIRKAPIGKLPLVKGKPRLGACVGGVGNLQRLSFENRPITRFLRLQSDHAPHRITACNPTRAPSCKRRR